MPFAGYESFEACVADNQDKANPEAFCAWLHHHATGQWPGEKSQGGEQMPGRPEDSFEFIRERVERTVWRELDNHSPNQGEERDMIVVHTFPDSVIVKNMVNDKFYEVPYVRQDTEFYLGQMKEVESVYVYKKLEEHNIDPALKAGLVSCELTGPIVMKDDEKRIAYAAVLVPNEPDSDGEIVTKEKIEQAAHEWMESYRNVDLQHTLNNVAVPVESYILPIDMTVKVGDQDLEIPKGTWILASKVIGDETWEAVKEGRLTGYSVMGIKRQTLESATKGQDVALKKTLLRDLGPDWVAAAVSIVNEPAVPKAKFFALKSKTTMGSDVQKTTGNRISGFFKDLLGGQQRAEKEGMRYAEDIYINLRQAFDSLARLVHDAETERKEKGKFIIGEESNEEGSSQDGSVSQNLGSKSKEVDEMNEEQIKALIGEAVKEAVQPVQDEVKALKEKVEQEPAANADDDGGDTNGQDGDGGQQSGDDWEAFKTQIVERLDALEQKVGKSKASPKGLKGQDGEESGEEPKSAMKGRDFFGRRVSK